MPKRNTSRTHICIDFVSYEISGSVFEFSCLQSMIGGHLVSSYDTRCICTSGGTIAVLSYGHKTISPRTSKTPGWSASGLD